MAHPFPKSVSTSDRLKKLAGIVTPEDSLCILINADPDAMASALALKRLFWRKARRVSICRVNEIKRSDNQAFVRLLKLDLIPIENLKPREYTRWAVVDGQPDQHELFTGHDYDIVIDHHPPAASITAGFVDIREKYGATASIMTEYLRGSRIRPSPRLATALYYGIKTDTDNFVRESTPGDINAFRYLYRFANTAIIKKIESSEMTLAMLDYYRRAMDRLVLTGETGFIHLGRVDNPDSLVMIADFFMRLVETTRCIVSGEFGERLIVILRNAGLKGDAGKEAQKVFAGFDASAGGHRSAARAEIPLADVTERLEDGEDTGRFVQKLFSADKKR